MRGVSNKHCLLTFFILNETQITLHFFQDRISAMLEIKTNLFLAISKTGMCLLTSYFLYPPQTLFVVGILFSRCPCVRVCVHACVRVCVCGSVTFCFFNILNSHCWIFIKPCKHVHICKTNTLDKKVRARGQFY